MTNKIKKILQKGNYTRGKIIISIIITILLEIIFFYLKPYRILDRSIILFCLGMFIFVHFIFRIEDIYNFIIKYRFRIAVLLLIYIMIMGYSGSSIGNYSGIIQGEYQEEDFLPVFGKARGIRSDEFAVSTLITLSQGQTENKFSYFNDYLRGTMTDMFSLTSTPVKDIVTLGRPFNLLYLFGNATIGLAFSWYGKVIALLLVSFEFCMMLTNKNKFASIAGTIIIVFSSAVQWWNAVEAILYGMFVILIIDKFLCAKNYRTKILCAIGCFFSGLAYIFMFYPAWQLSYGYIYLALFIWVCIKNRKKYKFNFKDVILVLLVLTAIAGVTLRYYVKSLDALNAVLNTDYPGERFEIGGGGAKIMFSYIYSMLLPYIETNNPCEVAGMNSVFPIPLIISYIYIIRNRKRKNYKEQLAFLIPMLIVSTVFSIWTIFPTNSIFAKITLLYMVPAARMAIPLGFSQVLLMIYLLGNLNKDDVIIKKKNISQYLSVVLGVILVYIALKLDTLEIFNGIYVLLFGLIFIYIIYQLLNINKEENKTRYMILMIFVSLIGGATVNPVQKGVSVITNKPISKQIQEIVKNDSENNLWIADNTNFYIPNYILANGAKIINSTNMVPNFELYEILLGEEEAIKEENKSIYNRYAHILVEITEDENKVELIYQDCIKIYITPTKLQELGVKYVVTTRGLDEFNTENIEFDEKYSEYGLSVYKVNY